jgi:CRISPR-associated protein Cas2
MADEDRRWRLICYDIRDPRRWRQVHKIVRGCGRRVQYSVFRARLDDRQLERVRWRLAAAMAPEDSLLIVDLCPACASNVVSRNHVEGWSDPRPPTHAIIDGSGNKDLSVVGKPPRDSE